tara:strand:- start:10200 stop:11060 length:861 start_codon:yes stop_codon:yes gene_type:complete
MIVQITRTKNEAFLIKEMLPLWAKYADGFVFYDDGSTDDTVKFLKDNKKKYNILEIIEGNKKENYIEELKMETDERQPLYNAAYKYSNKIICCDSDEYLDGSFSKQDLENLLESNPDTVFNLQWVQYTSKNTVRVDGPWGNNFKVRAGSYISQGDFGTAQMHSLHLPPTTKTEVINPSQLFIAHLQWLSKRWVGVKQYFWKINDYVNREIHGAEVIEASAYDVSVNNFNWQYSQYPIELKVDEKIYESQDMKANYKLDYIKKYTSELTIPNLGDWGMGIYEYCLKK